MTLDANTILLLTGTGIGFALAIIGGFVEYWASIRSYGRRPPRLLPSCLLYAGGGLTLAGIIALVVSFFWQGSLGPALLLGAGVLGGFYVGFTCLLILWILIDR